MKSKINVCFVFLMLFLCVFTVSVSAETLNGVEIKQGEWKGNHIEYLDREILIGLNPDKSQAVFSQQIETLPLEIVRNADRFGFMKIRVNDGDELFTLIEEINQLESVRYAEPNMVDRLLVTPDDPLYSTQWHYHNIGQTPPGGTIDADIDAPEGWDISTGSDTIIVGVLDSGIPIQGGVLSHPDLDDPNRFIFGKDIVNNDMIPTDDNGHGTHVSGTIGAESNNGIGVAGVAWNVKVMAIKVFDSGGSGSHEYFRDGCIYGVDNGCKVLNYSGGGSAGEAKEHGVAYADSNGVVLCAAAGNNNQGSVSWPGAYSLQYSNVICVSSTDPDDNSSSFSSIGAEVTIAAPGGSGSPYDADDIQSTFPNYPCYITTNYGLPESYGPLAGTSMATPHVAGFAALILSMNPGLTPDSVRQIMMNTSDDLGPAGFDNQFGYGRINVYNALSQMGSIIITHSPLEDTRDSLNDYEVLATIWSMEDLVADSLLLYYELNSTWYEEIMTPGLGVDEFLAYIPAQQPGTTINYYIYAQNVEGDADTTDTHTFLVIDYGLTMEPENYTLSAPALDTIWYDFMLTNQGAYADQYSLEIFGDDWETSIWDDLQTSVISSTPSMSTGQTFAFYVRSIVPSSMEGEFDSLDLVATSAAVSSVTATSIIKSISAGQPWEIPFTDLFVTTSFEIAKWESTAGATINNIGIDEPSAPYSVNLNGDPDGGDEIITEMINLKDQVNVIVKYLYQQTGGAESPDADDDLIIEYLNIDSNWIVLAQHLGSGPDMTEYVENEIQLPAEALHAGFRLKISCTATAGAYDDWFVDDLYIGNPTNYEVRTFPNYQTQYGPAGDESAYTLSIWNKGLLSDVFDLSWSGDWSITFYDAAGINPLTSTTAVPGGDTIQIVAKVSIPGGTPLHMVGTSTATITSQGDNNVSAYAILETTSAGTPVGIPWYEDFPDDTLRTHKWFTYTGAVVSTYAANEPSGLYSINLDGSQDTLSSQVIDLSGLSSVLLSYYYERGGVSDPPEAGDNLWVEYLNSSGLWTNLNTYEGLGPIMTDFEYVSLELPPAALHSSLQIRFRSFGESAGSDNWFVDNIRVDYAPEFSSDPGAYSETLMQGDSTTVDLMISNTGAGGLIYNINVNPHLKFNKADDNYEVIDYPEEVYTQSPAKGDDIDYIGLGQDKNAGGPDDYGYYWLDSDEPGGPSYNWINISSTGIDIVDSLSDDNFSGPYNLGFDFPYYGGTYDQIYISSNGIIGFAEAGMDARISRPIPTGTSPNAIIALLWDDLNPDDADNSDVHVYFKSDAGQCVVTYENYPEYRANAGDIVTMQMILTPSGTIKMQYEYVAPGFDKLNCTVGIESQNGDDGIGVVYHAAYLKDKLAVEFFKPFDWLHLSNLEGIVEPGQADTIECKFVTDTTLDAGLYTSDIVIKTNDPLALTQYINAELLVTLTATYLCGDANSSDDVNVSDAVYIINYVFVQGSPVPDPLDAAEVNCDGNVNVSDAVYIINYVFVGGPDPCVECK